MIVFPNAKINVGLRILNRRDDGYHNIESIMVPVKLADALELTPSADGKFGFTSSGIEIEGDPGDNLCVKAFRLMQSRYQLPEVKIHLHKVIPAGAGLGGGSSDAAFTLRLLNRMFSLRLCNQELGSMAAELGSDCTFFIENRPALAGGRGELLSHADFSLHGYQIAIVKPHFPISTAEAYSLVKPSGIGLPLPEIQGADPEKWKDLLINDFELPVIEKWPEIGDLKQQFMDMGAVYASLSGSGSAVFGLFRSFPHALKEAFGDRFLWTGSAV